jgi:hypothetical protein
MKDRVCPAERYADSLDSAIVNRPFDHPSRARHFEQESYLVTSQWRWFSSLRKIRLVLVFGLNYRLNRYRNYVENVIIEMSLYAFVLKDQYSLESISEDGRTLVFKSTSVENIRPGWVARETYRFLSENEFIETFALAGPEKEFETYSETQFRRKK